jgi:TP901 family phage tail tape measure protein
MVALGGILAGGATIGIVIQAVDEFTNIFKGITSSIMNFGKDSIKAFADFELQMTHSFNMFDEVSEESKDSATKLARTLSKKLAISANDVAKSFWYFGSAGFEVKDTMEALEPVLKFAKVNTLGIAEASDFAMTAMKVWNVEASEMPSILDQATFAMKNAKMSMLDMQQSFSYVAPVAAEFGMGIAETSVLIGALADAGITGSMAGTVLRRSMINLLAPTGAAKEAIATLGLQVFDETGTFRGMNQVLADYQEKTKGMNDEQKAAFAQAIFGTRAVAGMTAVVSKGADVLDEMTQNTEAAVGTIDEMNKAIEETVADKFKRLDMAMEDIKIGFGGLLAAALLPFLEIITTQLLPAMEPFLTILGEMASEVGEMLAPVFEQFINEVLPELMIMFKELRPYLMEMLQTFIDMIPTMLELFKVSMPWFILLSKMLILFQTGLLVIVTKFWQLLAKLFIPVLNELNPIIEWMGDAIDRVSESFKDVYGFIQRVVNIIGELASAIVKIGGGIFSSIIESVIGGKQFGGEIRTTGVYTLQKGERVIPNAGVGTEGVTIYIESIYGVDADDIADALQDRLNKLINY